MEAQQAEADVMAARANLARANLDLGFTYIKSPINGRAGEVLVKPGNLVAPNESLLTTVVSVDPVYVTFTGDERAYLRYQDLARNGGRASSRDMRNPVLVGLANEEGFPHKGEDGLRRQRARSDDGHDPGARSPAESRRNLNARAFRARPSPRRVAEGRAADPRAGDTHGPGSPLRLRRRREERRGAQGRDSSGLTSRACW